MVSRVQSNLPLRLVLITCIGAAQVVKALRKYGKAVPESLIAAAENSAVVRVEDDTGTDPAVPNDQYDSAYLSPVTVGSNTVHLDFDTGSADL
jgi:hypothetical protein